MCQGNLYCMFFGHIWFHVKLQKPNQVRRTRIFSPSRQGKYRGSERLCYLPKQVCMVWKKHSDSQAGVLPLGPGFLITVIVGWWPLSSVEELSSLSCLSLAFLPDHLLVSRPFSLCEEWRAVFKLNLVTFFLFFRWSGTLGIRVGEALYLFFHFTIVSSVLEKYSSWSCS